LVELLFPGLALDEADAEDSSCVSFSKISITD
jgi:hypothetical protein